MESIISFIPRKETRSAFDFVRCFFYLIRAITVRRYSEGDMSVNVLKWRVQAAVMPHDADAAVVLEQNKRVALAQIELA